ncbi:MAG TPA: CHAP domain-containing protein [Chryseosolibacter sp.]
MKRIIYVLVLICIFGIAAWLVTKFNGFTSFEVGEEVDNFHGVPVFYNGHIDHVSGRNTAADGYNIGLKYQCVEFVKRYYYEHLKHKMPDSYGHAKDFFDKKLADGERNKRRGLTQFSNPSNSRPQVSDLVVFNGGTYGHVAIISAVSENEVEIIQQNPGPYSSSRETFALEAKDDKWYIKSQQLLGWLRKVD